MVFVLYAKGICHVSVCTDLTDREAIATEANRIEPTGIDSPWAVSPDPTFRGGEPNPCPCDREPGLQHWLLRC